MTLVDVDSDQRRDCFGGLGGDAGDGSVELVVSSGARAEQESEGVVVFGDPPEVGAKPEFGLALAVGGVSSSLGDVGQEPFAHLVDERLIQVALGVEVLIQHGFGDTDGIGDVVHRGAMETVGGEHFERNVEDLLPAGGGGETRGHQ